MIIKPEHREYILTIACPDRSGIAAAVAGFIARHNGFILESAQYGDAVTNKFFQRIHFRVGKGDKDHEGLQRCFDEEVGAEFSMKWAMHDAMKKPRILIMVSKFSHCLNTLLHRYQNGTLNVEIPLVISNHPDLQRLVAWYDIPYYHLPINDKYAKEDQESRVKELAEENSIDLLVLARYMQILSTDMCHHFSAKAINIHHSFLPSFKGARPYHQAHARGVKIIGATAHYVTADLDEGPIIEQEIARVDHKHTVEELVSVGQEIESKVLYRAVRHHCEHRVLLNENKTVVF